MRKYLTIYEEAVYDFASDPSEFPYTVYEENFIFCFISALVLKGGGCDEHFLTFLFLANMRKLCVFLTMFFQEGKPSRRMCVLYLYFCLLITFCSSTYTHKPNLFLIHHLVFPPPPLLTSAYFHTVYYVSYVCLHSEKLRIKV